MMFSLSCVDRDAGETAFDQPPLGLPQGLAGFCASLCSGSNSSSAEAVEPLGQAQWRLVEDVGGTQ